MRETVDMKEFKRIFSGYDLWFVFNGMWLNVMDLYLFYGF